MQYPDKEGPGIFFHSHSDKISTYAASFQQHFLERKTVAIEYIEVDWLQHAVYAADFAVLPEDPAALDAGMVFAEIVRHP